MKRYVVVLVELGVIAGPSDFRGVRRRHFAIVKLHPIDRLEPGMRCDVLDAVFEVSVALAQVGLQNVLDEVLQVDAERRQHSELPAANLLHHLHLVWVADRERRVAGAHFVEKNPVRPPVDAASVAFALNDFRRDVLGRSAHGVSAILDGLAEAEVGYLEESFVINHDVLGLQISVNHSHLVDVLERQSHLSRIKAGEILVELLRSAKDDEGTALRQDG